MLRVSSARFERSLRATKVLKLSHKLTARSSANRLVRIRAAIKNDVEVTGPLQTASGTLVRSSGSRARQRPCLRPTKASSSQAAAAAPRCARRAARGLRCTPSLQRPKQTLLSGCCGPRGDALRNGASERQYQTPPRKELTNDPHRPSRRKPWAAAPRAARASRRTSPTSSRGTAAACRTRRSASSTAGTNAAARARTEGVGRMGCLTRHQCRCTITTAAQVLQL